MPNNLPNAPIPTEQNAANEERQPLLLSDYDYLLPAELIAQNTIERGHSRLLIVGEPKKPQHQDAIFNNLLDLLSPGDVLVCNNSKVMAARLFGEKATGGKVELLLERLLPNGEAWAHIKASHGMKVGAAIFLWDNSGDGTGNKNGTQLMVLEKKESLYRITISRDGSMSEKNSWQQIMDTCGHLPLPPYIARAATQYDAERYQTVYGKQSGSVAAHTAGLHFSENLLQALKNKGVEIVEVTLHIGAGTFQPVREQNILNHQMHEEWFCLDAVAAEKINQAKRQGRRVIAVGTTSLRALESAWLALNQPNSLLGKADSYERMPTDADTADGGLSAIEANTQLFIYPGFKFRVVDSLITNFHLPQSSLLMLVAAFAGYSAMKDAYAYAIANRYRFFSYGDAMWLVARSASVPNP